jgi:hypothetical protein
LWIKAAISVAAVFDIAENVLMIREFRSLDRLSERLVSATTKISLMKWSTFAVASWLLGFFIWGVSSTPMPHASILKLIAGCMLLSAALTSFGISVNRWIGIGVLPLLPALGCTAWLFLSQ